MPMLPLPTLPSSSSRQETMPEALKFEFVFMVKGAAEPNFCVVVVTVMTTPATLRTVMALLPVTVHHITQRSRLKAPPTPLLLLEANTATVRKINQRSARQHPFAVILLQVKHVNVVMSTIGTNQFVLHNPSLKPSPKQIQ